MANQKGIAHLIPIVIVLAIVAVGGWWLWKNYSADPSSSDASALPEIRLLKPNGGEAWRIGTDKKIVMCGKYFQFTPTVNILLLNQDGSIKGVIGSASELKKCNKNKDTKFPWSAGAYSLSEMGATMEAPGGRYKIKVILLEGSTERASDMSDSNFRLLDRTSTESEIIP